MHSFFTEDKTIMRTGLQCQTDADSPTEAHTPPIQRSYGRKKSCLLASVAAVDVCSAKLSLTRTSCSPSLVCETRRGTSCWRSSVSKRKGAASRPDLCSCAAEANQGDQFAPGMRVVAVTRSELLRCRSQRPQTGPHPAHTPDGSPVRDGMMGGRARCYTGLHLPGR